MEHIKARRSNHFVYPLIQKSLRQKMLFFLTNGKIESQLFQQVKW